MMIEYTAKPGDVAALYSYTRNRSMRVAMISYGLPVGAAVLFLVEIRSIAGTLTPADWILGLIWGAAFFFLFPLILRLRTKKEKRTLSIQPAGLSTQIGNLTGDVPWTKVDSMHVTDEHIFLVGKNTNGFAIPRRAFAEENERREFIRLCEQYIQMSRS